jgi:hypothetical protein
MTPLEAIDKLKRGDVFVVPVIPSATERHGDAEDFRDVGLRAGAVVRRGGRPLEGDPFPDTHALSRRRCAEVGEDHEGRVRVRADADLRGGEERGLTTAARHAGVDRRDGNRKPAERPLVASVYENRLRIGMALQCDPTVIYALELVGRYDGNIRRDDRVLTADNTYRYPGLLPGPIASPGKASLLAVVHPATTYLPRQQERRLARACEHAGRTCEERAPIPGGYFAGAAAGWKAGKGVRLVGGGRQRASPVQFLAQDFEVTPRRANQPHRLRARQTVSSSPACSSHPA